MTNKQKNTFVVVAVFAVMLLILFNYSKRSSQLSTPIAKSTSLFFPTQKVPQTIVMQALLVGKLSKEGNCIKVNENLIVWPFGFSVKEERNAIKIFNDKGRVIATVGDTVKLGGGQVEANQPNSEYQNADCKGPFWIVGDVLPVK